ncbi:Sec-independent protein translocase subunit TatA [Dietzia sp. PP-33]|jgi:sec-independent protein translocase protein TatA|uniref:Sec-independent protein translocase subunit TatA n=1 Tax=Dietzia sp. PP-33 TaxID=2957500 RepID=UPI0029A2B8B0|nr:Sec-independent protein translocase subunit TatA [Dietzia sp. PP-33]MDX2355392.1 Sec-independent protein translocase subunit TatA [Dietzia sp. PP-33]
MGALSIWHWLIVLAVVLLLFGSKKLPEAARGLGRSMRIFKSEIKEMQNDDKQGAPAGPEEPQALTQAGQPTAAQYAQPQSPPQQAQPQAYPQQAQGYPQAPQQPYQQAPQQPQAQQPQQPNQQPNPPQQHFDPTAPYNGGTGSPGQ